MRFLINAFVFKFSIFSLNFVTLVHILYKVCHKEQDGEMSVKYEAKVVF